MAKRDDELVQLVDELIDALSSHEDVGKRTMDRSAVINAMIGRYFGEANFGGGAEVERLAEQLLLALGTPYKFEGAWS